MHKINFSKRVSCQNSYEADTAENITGQQQEKDTMGSDDRSSDGDTFTERQGQVKNVVKERRKCNNLQPTNDDVFCNENISSVMIFSLL